MGTKLIKSNTASKHGLCNFKNQTFIKLVEQNQFYFSPIFIKQQYLSSTTSTPRSFPEGEGDGGPEQKKVQSPKGGGRSFSKSNTVDRVAMLRNQYTHKHQTYIRFSTDGCDEPLTQDERLRLAVFQSTWRDVES